jgi:tyrosine-protein kinase Etk/Wzc
MSASPFDLLGHLRRRWRIVALTVFLGICGGGVYGFVAPKWYQATLRVVPSQSSRDSSTAMLLAASLPSIGGLDSSPSAGVQRIHAVLTSNSVADAVIDKFDLMRRYNVEHRELAREELWKHCASAVDRKSGVVALTCEDKEPDIAVAVATYFGEEGNRVFGRVSASSAREERRFLENQVIKARKDVDAASQKLREFQEKHKIVDLPEQSKAVISAMASIKGELISKQLELSYLRGFSGRTESGVTQLQQQISIMEEKLQQLEASQTIAVGRGTGSGTAAGSGEFFPGAMTVPELRFELEQLLREQKIRETVFFLMTQRFEMAKVDEARDTSTFQILDYPTKPTYKARPRRFRALVAGGLIGLLIATALVAFPLLQRRLTA